MPVSSDSLQDAIKSFGDTYGLDLRFLRDPSSMTYIIRNMENGNEVRITDQLIMNQKSVVEVKEVIKTALRQMVAGESPMRQKLDYSRLDSAYTKYVRNKAKRGQIGSTTETLNEIFPVTILPLRATADSKNQSLRSPFQYEQKKKSNVMPETKKRAITLEEL